MISWAARAGIASTQDLQLVLDTERGRSVQSRDHGISQRTLRRRRTRTLAALKAASQTYLAAA